MRAAIIHGIDPPRIQKYMVYLAILVRIPWKITNKCTNSAFNAEPSSVIQLNVKWHFFGADDGPLTVVFGSFLLPSSIKKKVNKFKKKTLSKLDPYDKTVWIRPCFPIVLDMLELQPKALLCEGSFTRVHVTSHKVSFNTEKGECFNKPRAGGSMDR